jgi:hypothetical protein
MDTLTKYFWFTVKGSILTLFKVETESFDPRDLKKTDNYYQVDAYDAEAVEGMVSKAIAEGFVYYTQVKVKNEEDSD